MSSSLSVTTKLTDDNEWEVLASIISGGTLPLDIFVYENTGTTSLGKYRGVASLPEYQRIQTFTGTPIVKFGNRFVKTTQAKIVLGINDDVDQAISTITNSVIALSLSLSSSSETTKIISIP